ncbi:ABC transporter permease, partial [Neisseria sp. P0001.S005]
MFRTMKKKKSTSNPTWQAFKQHKRGWLALRILAVLFVVTLLAPLWSNDKPLWIRYQGEYFFPLVNEYNETAFGGDFDTPADYLDPLIRHNITSDGNFALYLPNPYDADTLNDFDT